MLHIRGMEEKRLFAERLKQAMREAGYDPRPSVLEREFNLRFWGKPITFQGVRRWLRGESLPSQDKLTVLAQWLKVEPQQLRYGAADDQGVGEPPAAWRTEMSDEERELLDTYRALPEQQRDTLREVAAALAVASGVKPR
ncbi:transcriptional regulator [Halomonas salipaludis]|nr:transcriptional regulator [Halomonas salipaludis]